MADWVTIGDAPSPAPESGGWQDVGSAGPEKNLRKLEQATQPEKRKYSFGEEAFGAVVEPAMEMASGAVAKPVSDIAGLGALGMEGARRLGVPFKERDPLKVKQETQEALTVRPKTQAGQAVSEYNPIALLGQLIGKGAQKAEEFVAPPQTSGPLRSAIGSGVRETIEQLPQLAGAKGGAISKERLPGKQAALDIEKQRNLPKDVLREEAQSAGLTTPPEGFTFSGLAGKAKVASWISGKNQPEFNRLVSEELGLPKGVALSDEELARYRAEKAQAYERVTKALTKPPVTEAQPSITRTSSILDPSGKPITQEVAQPPVTRVPGIATTPEFRTKIEGMRDELQSLYESGPATFSSLKQSIDILDEQLTKEHNPRQAMVKVRQLRTDASADFKRGDAASLQSAFTRRAVADAFEDMFEQDLARTGQTQLLTEFRDARKKIAQAHAVEDSLDPAGNVNARKLYMLSEKKPLTGNLKLVADYAGAFPEGAKKVGAKEGASFWDFGWIVMALAARHPLAAAADVGIRLGIPFAAEKGFLQKRTPSYRASTTPQAALPAFGMATTQAAEQVQPPPQ